jgi:hypothetical protein
MKTKLRLSTAVLLLAATATLAAAPLLETTAIHAQPDATTPAIGYLKAGTEPGAAASVTAPEGWMAIELPGPHEAYVNNNDFSKSLDVHPGAAIRLMPMTDAPVLTTMQEGDKTEITGLRSGWTQIKLYKTVIGYIKVGGASPAPLSATATVQAMPPPSAVAAGQPAPVISSAPAAALPQVFQGLLAKAGRILLIGPRRDYDYQLNDAAGKRIAFLEVTKVLATEKMELYLGRPVKVSGVLKQTYNGKNLVIEVVSLEPQ